MVTHMRLRPMLSPRFWVVIITAVILAAIIAPPSTAFALVRRASTEQQPTTDQGSMAPAASGALAGRVTNWQGEPVAQIRVTLHRREANSVDEWPILAALTTTADGTYGFQHLPSGVYRLRFLDLRWPEQYIHAYYGQSAVLQPPIDIMLADGVQFTDLVMPLRQFSQISGSVTDQAGQPIPRLTVRLYHDPDRDGQWTATGVTGLTNTTGVYTITRLAPEAYRLEWIDQQSPRRYQPKFYQDAPTLTAATTITLADGSFLRHLDAQLASGGAIQGQVTDSNGQPLRSGNVFLYPADCIRCGNALLQTTIDANGFYSLGGLAAGNYHVGVAFLQQAQPFYYYRGVAHKEAATPVNVTTGAITPGINIQIPAMGAVGGVVVGPTGQPLLQITVSAYRQITYTTGPAAWSLFDAVPTASNGHYTLPFLAPGRYLLVYNDNNGWDRYYSRQYYPNAFSAADATVITVTAGITLTGFDVQLVHTGKISGQVQDAAGAPLNNIKITAQSLTAEPPGLPPLSLMTSTTITGAYMLVGVDIGAYQIVFSDGRLPARYPTIYYDNASDTNQARPLVVTAEAHLTGINAQLVAAASDSVKVWVPLIYR